MVDNSLVKYASAFYILVLPKQFITSTGKQVYVWLYRKNTNERFGRINVGVNDDFEFAVVKNYFVKTDGVKQSNTK